LLSSAKESRSPKVAAQPRPTTALVSADGGILLSSAKESRSPKVALLVRTYAPTAEMTKRIAQWVSSLQSSSDVDAFISIDQTQEHNVSSLLNKLRSTGFNLSRIHTYTTDDMLQAYPALKGKSRLPRVYHTPAIDLFLQTLPQNHSTYDYLWVLEDDVGYTGDMSKLLEAYSRSDDDLIGGSMGGYGKATSLHAMDQTDLYKKWVPSTQRIFSEEHMTRTSARLLGKLHDWMVAGALDMSEVMPATVCQIEHMQYSSLKEEDLGDPYTCDHNKDIDSQAVWEAIQSKDAAEAHPRLYHAVKV